MINNKLFEPEHRFCPICDKEIKEGSKTHHCSKKKLIEIEKHNTNFDDEYSEEERTFDDKLKEFEDHFDNDRYYTCEED